MDQIQDPLLFTSNHTFTPSRSRSLQTDMETEVSVSLELQQWATDNDINSFTLTKLASAGFTSMTSVKLLEESHLDSLQIEPLAQRLLLMAAVNNLKAARQTERRRTCLLPGSADVSDVGATNDYSRVTNMAAPSGTTTTTSSSPPSNHTPVDITNIFQGLGTNATSEMQQQTPLDTLLNTILQSQQQNTNAMHSTLRSRADLDPLVYVQTRSQQGLFSWHPTLMSIAFALLMAEAILFFSPESTLLPKALRKTKVRYHWINNVTAVVCALIGFGCIFLNKTRMGKSHFTSWHGLLGVVTISYACMQCIAGTFLLYPKVLSQMVKLADMKLYHATSGLLLFSLACGSLALGLFSNWFVSASSDVVWYITASCPSILALVVMNQVTRAYIPKAFKKPSQQF